jgi:magnesium-transporting ATPase (P-type)
MATDDATPKDINPDYPEEWREWQKFGHTLVRESLKSQDETAKYVIGLISTVVTLYTTVLTYLGLSGQASLSIYITVPLGIMIMSLAMTLFVFKPETEQIDLLDPDPVGIMNTVVHRSIHKYYFLSGGILLFIAGIIAIPIVIGIGMTPAPQEVRFIVSENSKLNIENVSMTFESNSLKTTPYTLLQQDQKTYTVLLSDGSRAVLNKDWVQAIVYLKAGTPTPSVCYTPGPASEVFLYQVLPSDQQKNSILKMPEITIFPNRLDLVF